MNLTILQIIMLSLFKLIHVFTLVRVTHGIMAQEINLSVHELYMNCTCTMHEPYMNCTNC